MTQSSLVTFDEGAQIENAVATLLFIVPAAIIAAMAGVIAIMCVRKGGNVEFKTKFWALVQVTCKFR